MAEYGELKRKYPELILQYTAPFKHMGGEKSVANDTVQATPTSDRWPSSIGEARKVLAYLGVDSDIWIDMDSFDDMLALICEQEAKLIGSVVDRKGDINSVKEIFNQHATTQKKKEHLHNYLTTIEK